MNTNSSNQPGVPPPPTNANPEPAPNPPSPFPQAKGESDRAFEAFRAYLELGPKRRLAAVARAVGASLRTVQRWATDFDWRGRIKTCAANSAEQYIQTENTVRREILLGSAERAKAFRNRQYALAETVLDAAERYLATFLTDDLGQMTFGDACKALEVASRLGQQVARADAEADNLSAVAHALSTDPMTLFRQAFPETQTPNTPGDQPQH